MREIVLPEKIGRAAWRERGEVQKVSAQRKHARAQTVFAAALLTWADSKRSGRVGTEWEFRIASPGEQRRPLVPDVAFLSYRRMPYEDGPAADIPRVAPDVVVEVLSPGDAMADVT